jgi:hypothetical protein
MQHGRVALTYDNSNHMALVSGGLAATVLAASVASGLSTFSACAEGATTARPPQPAAQESKPTSRLDTSVIESRDFVVYDHTGTAVSLSAVTEALRKVQVALIGEYHDDPIAHALEVRGQSLRPKP